MESGNALQINVYAFSFVVNIVAKSKSSTHQYAKQSENFIPFLFPLVKWKNNTLW
jgi:hypothetical protein